MENFLRSNRDPVQLVSPEELWILLGSVMFETCGWESQSFTDIPFGLHFTSEPSAKRLYRSSKFRDILKCWGYFRVDTKVGTKMGFFFVWESAELLKMKWILRRVAQRLSWLGESAGSHVFQKIVKSNRVIGEYCVKNSWIRRHDWNTSSCDILGRSRENPERARENEELVRSGKSPYSHNKRMI